MIDQQSWIELVSPQQISVWTNRIIPNGEMVGEVIKSYTFRYKTNKPEKDGIFCERSFGVIKRETCACDRRWKRRLKFYEHGWVECVNYWIWRNQVGYIKLICPSTHVKYLIFLYVSYSFI